MWDYVDVSYGNERCWCCLACGHQLLPDANREVRDLVARLGSVMRECTPPRSVRRHWQQLHFRGW